MVGGYIRVPAVCQISGQGVPFTKRFRLTADKPSFQRPTDEYLLLWPAQCAGSVQLSESSGGNLYGSHKFPEARLN